MCNRLLLLCQLKHPNGEHSKTLSKDRELGQTKGRCLGRFFPAHNWLCPAGALIIYFIEVERFQAEHHKNAIGMYLEWWVIKGHGQNNNINDRIPVWPRYSRWTKQYEEYHLNRNLKHIHITICPCMLSHFCHVQLFVTIWTVAHQAPLFMGYFRQEYWSGLPCPPPGDLPKPGIEPVSFVSYIGRRFLTSSVTWEEPHIPVYI